MKVKKAKAQPKRDDLNYLIGFFKVELGTNDAKVAKAMAEKYLKGETQGESKVSKIKTYDELSGPELVKAYNTMAAALDDNLVVRFATRKIGVARCTAMLQKYEAESVKPQGQPPRREKVARSWQDDDVRVARATRHAVRVTKDGKTQEFRSVRAAFDELGLPMGKHIKFRMELKAAGELDRFDYTWKVIEA